MSLESITIPSRTVFKFDWLLGKRIDLLFFYLPILAGLLCYYILSFNDLTSSVFLAVLVSWAFGAGPLHLGATWFAYFDKKNLTHYWNNKKKRIVFFFMPVVILAVTVVGVVIIKPLILFIWQVWSIQHLVQQNVGILLLYHRPNGGEAIVTRSLEVRSQQFAAIFFYLVFFHRVMMKNLPFMLVDIAKLLALIAAVVMVCLYVAQLVRQIQQGRYLNISAFSFWIFSVLCLAPLAYMGRDYLQAVIIPLTVHWFQYIIINYVLVKRKYTTGATSNLPSRQPILLFMLVCAVVLILVVTLDVLSKIWLPETILQRLVVGVLLSIGLTHYYLDAFLWRFRDPFQRENVLPYVKSTA